MIPIFNAEIAKHNGIGWDVTNVIVFDAPARVSEYLKTFDHKRVEVIIRKPKTKRSDNQNRYYWSVVIDLLSKELGYDQDELHEILKYKFLKKESALNGMEYVKSTAKLTTGEFEEYLEKIRRWAAGFLNINIPLPNECEAA